MEQSNAEIRNLITNKLSQSAPSVPFCQVWDKHKKSDRKIFGLKRVIAVPMTAVVSLLALLIVGFTFAAIEDNTDYPFINDASVIGKWQTVDYVKSPEQFTPGEKSEKGDLFLSELVFINEGQMLTAMKDGNGKLAPSTFTWTKGLVLNKQEKTAGKYEIKKINGSDYMFFEFKSGDYTYFHMKPKYFVLNKVDNIDYLDYKSAAIKDKVDYPFEDDPQLIGKWEVVDYVETIDDFNAGTRSARGELFLSQFDISENGKISGSTLEDEIPEGFLTWTKGLIIDQKGKTASKYEIKELKGETYLFYEWKSGSYTMRGMTPEYYVLKKVQ